MPRETPEVMGGCPFCGKELYVAEYACSDCGISIRGKFKRCDLCNLPTELLSFVKIFLKCQGNIREVERNLGISYPTIKNRLASVNQLLEVGEFTRYVDKERRLDLLNSFRDGRVSIDEVLRNI